MLVGGMGSGKTVVTLSAIAELLAAGELKQVLVLAPPRVCAQVWAHEHLKWRHLEHLKVHHVTGLGTARMTELKKAASVVDVIVVSYTLLPWIKRAHVEKHLSKADGLVLDELSSLKDAQGVTTKLVMKLSAGKKWRVGLTGTPTAEDFLGLYGQVRALDPDNKIFRGLPWTAWRKRYFTPIDFDQRQWVLKSGAATELLNRVGKVVHQLPDYTHELPELTIELVYLDMGVEGEMLYRRLAKDSVLDNVTAHNAAVLSGKLRQAAAGFVYKDGASADDVHLIHGAKWLEAGKLFSDHFKHNDSGLMTLYEYTYQRNTLARYGTLLAGSTPHVVDGWNSGEIKHLLAHPNSCGHGLNLQYGGHHQLWMGPTWSRDKWLQTASRLWRRGQEHPVKVKLLMAKNTIDDVMLARIQDKAEWFEMFQDHIQRMKKGG